MNKSEYDSATKSHIFKCPHCESYVVVHETELNCRIFRHALFKNTLKQIDPHMPEKECVYLTTTNQVIGCAKPFIMIKQDENTYFVDKCDYI